MGGAERWIDSVLWFPALFPVGAIVASVIWRRGRGRAIFAPKPTDAIFIERWTSGGDRRGFRAIGGARNCLTVAVTRTELIVAPHFPFTLMFMPEVWGLDQRRPLGCISRVTARRGLSGSGVDVVFDDGGGMLLRLRQPEAFIRALGRT